MVAFKKILFPMRPGGLLAPRSMGYVRLLAVKYMTRIALKDSSPPERRASITLRADIMTPSSSASLTQTAIPAQARASSGTICLRTVIITQ